MHHKICEKREGIYSTFLQEPCWKKRVMYAGSQAGGLDGWKPFYWRIHKIFIIAVREFHERRLQLIEINMKSLT